MRSGKKHFVIVGAAGRLGAATALELSRAGHRVSALTRADLDITNAGAVGQAIETLRPDVIINCSAYNAVDAAETELARAFAINARGPASLAAAADRVNAVFVHYSTDFVFDGKADSPYLEGAPTSPLSVYGASKLAGEFETRSTDRHYILRVESLFGGHEVAGQRTTIDFIADALESTGSVKAIVDRTVTPSYVPDVVRVTQRLLEEEAPFGTYHCVCSHATTWFDLAREIAQYMGGGRIVPVEAAAFPTVAPRPRYCALSNEKLARLGLGLPSWQTVVRRHLSVRQSAHVPAALHVKTA
jgi:dTDP-4-dehydrorhamnose reductase